MEVNFPIKFPFSIKLLNLAIKLIFYNKLKALTKLYLFPREASITINELLK